MATISADDTARLYQWIDEIPLSRPKRNIGRDFSDGVLAAELAAHFFPKLVELHNYSSANGVSQKMYNWNTLNKKVFNRLGMQVSKPDLERICNCEQVAVERVLLTLQNTIENIQESGSLPAQTKAPVKHHAPLKDKQPEPPVERHSAGAGGGRRDVSRHKEPQQRGVANRQPAADPYAPPPKDPSKYQPESRISSQPPAAQPVKAAYNLPHRDVDREILFEKEQTILELQETADILETKVRKLEQLMKLKDTKISSLQSKLQVAQEANSGMQ